MMTTTVIDQGDKRKCWSRYYLWICIVVLACMTAITHYCSTPFQKHISVYWVKGYGFRVVLEYPYIHTLNENTWITPNISRDANVYLKPGENTTLMLPHSFCQEPTKLLIFVMSVPHHFLLRKAVRDTWGSENNTVTSNVKTYFLTGQTFNQTVQGEINREFQKYGDIIQESFVDLKLNKTIKSLMMLKLVTTYCTDNVKFVMKTMDKVYVNVPRIIKNLEVAGEPQLLMGSLVFDKQPVRDENNVNLYCPEEIFNETYYPPHLVGSSYVMSIDMVISLYHAATKVPIFHLEDVYITGMLSNAIHVHPIGHSMFAFVKRSMEPCVLDQIAISHWLNDKQMRTLHKYMCRFRSRPKACHGVIAVSEGNAEFIPDFGADSHSDQQASLMFLE